MYGLTTPNADRTAMVPAKKPTKFMSNGPFILAELCLRCDKSHDHQPLVGGRASKAQEYPYESCRAICRGLSRQKQHDKIQSVRPGPLGIRQLKSLISWLSKRNFLEEFADKPDNY